MPRRITVITRRRCELCAELLEHLAPYAATDRLIIEQRDVDGDAALLAAHAWRVPVVMEGDQELLWGRIEAHEIVAAFGPNPAATGSPG